MESESSPPSRLSPRAGMGLFFGLALGVRLLHWAALRDLEFMRRLGLDAQFYHEWAQRLAAGEGSGDSVYFLGPLYPHFLALLYAVGGASVGLAQGAQMVLGAVTCALVYGAARRAFDATIAAFAATAFLLYGYLIFLELHLVTAPLLTTLVAGLAFLLADDRDRVLRWLGVGVVVGLLSLGRGVFLVALAVAGLLALAGAARDHRRATARRIALVVAGAVVVIAPVTVRNLVVGGEFVPVSANGGINYFIGNHDRASGLFQPVDGVEFFQPGSGSDGGSVTEASRRAGRELTPAEASAWWLREGLVWNRDHPTDTLALWGRKLLVLVSNYEVPQIENFGWARDQSGLLRWNPVPFGLLSALALVGLFLGARRNPATRRLALVWFAYAVALLPFFLTARYRVVLVPVMACFAGATLVALVRGFRGGNLARGGGILAAVAVLALALAQYQPAGVAAASDQLLPYQRGVVAMQDQQWNEAIRQFQLSAQRDDTHVPTLTNLAFCLGQVGRVDDALRMFGAAERLDPGNRTVLEAAATLALQSQRLEQAIGFLTKLDRVDPGNDWNLARLGDASMLLGRTGDALNYWRRVLQVSQDPDLLETARIRVDELGP